MRYCFYSGYKDLIGGYTTLTLTIIRELHKQGKEVVLINFTNGLFAHELHKVGATIRIIGMDFCSWKEIGDFIKPDDIFIVTSFEFDLRYLFKANPRVLYYDINDYIDRISEYKFGLRFGFLGKRLVTRLLAANSLVFMDDTGKDNVKRHFGIDITAPAFLPIPVVMPDSKQNVGRNRDKGEVLRLTYIGRSVSWKMMPLKRILRDCASCSVPRKIQFSIVVDSISEFERFIRIGDYQHKNLEISVEENLLPSAVNEFLLRRSDLHFAMGTAALDAGKLGIPTILVDYKNSEFPADYGYKWLYESREFSLGRNLDKVKADKGFSMDSLLRIFWEGSGDPGYHAAACYDYVLKSHSSGKIVKELMRICGNASFRLKTAKAYVPLYSNFHFMVKKIFERVRVKKGPGQS